MLKNVNYISRCLLFWVSFLLIPVLNSCTDHELEDQPMPAGKPKLVVTCFISPEEKGVRVSVLKSRVLFGPDTIGSPNIIDNATVTLSDGFSAIQIPFDPWIATYVDSFAQIMPGRTYNLTISTPDGLFAEATCTVPAKINTHITARFDSSVTQPESDMPDYIVETSWTDLPGEGDFYKVGVIQVLKDPENPSDSSFYAQPMANDALGRDFQADGRSFRVSTSTIFLFPQLYKENILRSFDIYLLTTDRNYYEYHRSLYRNQQSYMLEDPVQIFSNVKGGLGIFAAFRSYHTPFKL